MKRIFICSTKNNTNSFITFEIPVDKNGLNKNHTHNHTCPRIKREFRNSVTKLIECAMTNTSKEFDFCRDCSYWFADMRYRYNILATLRDVDPILNTNVSCIGEVFDLDRINVARRLYTEAKTLWLQSNCYDCYNVWNNTVINDTVVPQTLSDHTLKFFNLTAALNECINNKTKLGQESKDKYCKPCEPMYNELNTFYTSLIETKPGKKNLCYDIRIHMNKTRRSWSEHCCHNQTSDFSIFILLVSIIGALPVVFYSSAYVLTKQEEARNMQPLTEESSLPNASSINSDPIPGSSRRGLSGTSINRDENLEARINNKTQTSKAPPMKKFNIDEIRKVNNLNPVNLVHEQTNQQPTPSLIDLNSSASSIEHQSMAQSVSDESLLRL